MHYSMTYNMNTDKAFKQAKWNRIHSAIDSGTTLTDTKKQKFAGQFRSEHGVLYYNSMIRI